MAMIVKIKKPDLLPVIPDSILSKGEEWYGLSHYLNKQFVFTFSDHRIRDELQNTYNETEQFWENVKVIPAKELYKDSETNDFFDEDEIIGVPDYGILFGIEDRKDSFLQLNDNVQYLLGRLHWHHEVNDVLCHSSFTRDHQLLHVMEKDGCLFVAQLEEKRIVSIRDTLMCQLDDSMWIWDKQFSDKRVLLIDYNPYDKGCRKATAFIIGNGRLKRYDFGF